MTPAGASRRAGRGGRARYTLTRRVAVDLFPAAALCAVHAADGAATRVFYCEPATGRCSCGAPAGSCPHLAAVSSALDRPARGRRAA